MGVNTKNSSSIICSICEGRYAYGLAALINSAIKNGFIGQFYIIVGNEIPFWTIDLIKEKDTYKINDNCTIEFEVINWDLHLSYYKPYLLESLLTKNPNSDVFYFDPDVTIECDWNFFKDWVSIGPALCSDGNYPILGKRHPWVASWQKLFNIDKNIINSEIIPYVNSGFIGLNSKQIDITKRWIKFTELLINNGHNLKSFGPTLKEYIQKRAYSICGDQDILNAVLISKDYEISLFGVDGMGFNGSSFLMFHNIGKKTWDKNFIKDFLISGTRISVADDSYLKFLQGDINPYKNIELKLIKINVTITKLIQRIL
jgi:hypothetical protein